MKKDLFEPELARHLGPVKAPDELWDRVHGAARPGVLSEPGKPDGILRGPGYRQ